MNPLLLELAKSNRESEITADDCSAMGCYEAFGDLDKKRLAGVAELLAQNGITTETQMRAWVDARTKEEYEEVSAWLEANMPNPFRVPDPKDFCSYCDKRPDWWNSFSQAPEGSLKQLRRSKGYRHGYPGGDPENGPARWLFNGHEVVCDTCSDGADDDLLPEWVDVYGDAQVVEHPSDDPGYELYAWSMTIIGMLPELPADESSG